MANFKGTGSVKSFYDKASIQVTNKFLVTITDETNDDKKELYAKIGNMPKIYPWQIRSIQYGAGPEIDNMAHYFESIPSVNIEQDVREVTISFIENKSNNILAFAEWMFNKIVSPGGIHRSQTVNKISKIDIYTLDERGFIINHERLKDLYISKMPEISKSYDSAEIVTRDLSFKFFEREREIITKRQNGEDILKNKL